MRTSRVPDPNSQCARVIRDVSPSLVSRELDGGRFAPSFVERRAHRSSATSQSRDETAISTGVGSLCRSRKTTNRKSAPPAPEGEAKPPEPHSPTPAAARSRRRAHPPFGSPLT